MRFFVIAFFLVFCAFGEWLLSDSIITHFVQEWQDAQKLYDTIHNPTKQDKKASKDTIQNNPPQDIKSTPTTALNDGQKPKLLIIMDDIHTKKQLSNLANLGLNITPSLFPKTPYSPKTPQLIQDFTQSWEGEYMVHLPLQAINFAQNELEPIEVGVSKDTLREVLSRIKSDFPHLKFINNHTGSKFTSSKQDMQNLLEVLDEFGLEFIDSVTSEYAVSPKIAREQSRLIMQRDIFLDNNIHTQSIAIQINLAIAKAKKKGYAIAICHPHKETLQALRGADFSEVELISPSELQHHLYTQNIKLYNRSKFQYAQNF